jgi:hypothetical protein
MRIGIGDAGELKKRSVELEIPFADLLWGYIIEDFMLRIYDSRYGELWWLETYPVLGLEVYREKERKTLRFCYRECKMKRSAAKTDPGQKLTEPMAEHMLEQMFSMENIWQVHWRWDLVMESGEAKIHFVGSYRDMEVPINVVVRPISGEKLSSGIRCDALSALGGRELMYPIYAPESLLCREIYMIVERLELINDMESYYNAYRILKTESIKGRDVLDEMGGLLRSAPKVKKEQRIEQIAGYRSYAYMRKRWEKYARHHGRDELKWEEVLDLILTFLKPIWHCLCSDEVFFDDWMPEIGRFI